MIDVQDLTRRVLVQIVFTFVGAMIYMAFSPPETALVIKTILILGSLALLIGLIPGNFLWRTIPKIAARIQSISSWSLLAVALLVPIVLIYSLGILPYQNYWLISSLPNGLKEQLNLQQTFLLNLSECLLQFSILLSHSIFLLRSWLRSRKAV